MSFANLGIGLNAFAQGLNSGIDAGTKISGLVKQGQMRRARESGMADAKAARSSAIDNLIQTGSAPNADNTMTVPTYNVGDQSFADQGSARKAAESQVGSLEDFYQKVAAPKIYEQYLEIDPEKAQAWKDWNDNQQVKSGQKHWAQAIMKANMGDFDGFGKSLVKAYNTRGYLDDGTEVKDWKTLKDGDGNVTGAMLTFKGPDGKEFNQTVNGMEDAYRLGAHLLAPEQVFNLGWQEIQAAKKAQIATGQENIRQRGRVQLEGLRQQGRQQVQTQRDNAAMERVQTKAQLDEATAGRKAEAKVQALRKAGYPEDFIKQSMPAILGLGDYKKAAAPEEVRRMLHQARLADFSYQRKTPEEQAKIIEQDMTLIGGAGATPNPMSRGIQGQGQGQGAPASGVPMIYDTQTGKMVPYQR